MKTLKFKFLIHTLILVAILPFALGSCTKDTTDLRDQIIGQYSYTVKIYQQDGPDLVYLGDQADHYDLTGTMRVIKNSSDPTALDFYDGNDLMFQGINVEDAGNAIVFDVPSQQAWIGPGSVQVVGYNYWNVNSSGYHGAFLYDDSSVEIAFTIHVMDVESGLVMVLVALPK